MSTVTFSKTSRGGDMLTFQGYDYLRNSYLENLWRCRKIRTCRTSVTYIDGVVKPHNGCDHNHAPNELIETEIVQEEMEGAVVEELTPKMAKKRRMGSSVQEPASAEDDSHSEFPMAVIAPQPKEESPSFLETPKYPTAKRGGIHGTSGRASHLTAPSCSTPNRAGECGNSARQILSSVRVGTVEEDRFVQYIGGVLGMVDAGDKRRYIQAIKYTISKLDMDSASSDPELQSFLS